MGRQSVLFCASGSIPAAAKRMLEPIRGAWPHNTAPEATTGSITTALRTLEDRSGPASDQPLPTLIIAVLGPEESARTIDRLVEGLLARNVPGIVLMQSVDDWRSLQRHGVLFERLDQNPAVVAAMAYALLERQSTVDILSREIALAHRCQAGIRHEIDMIHEELHLAAAIQREFMRGALPEVPGLDLGLLFRPMNFVSGDIYNVTRLSDRHVGFFVADAVGHGVPAALLTMVLTNSLCTTELGEDGRLKILPPATVLHRLNRKLCEDQPGSSRFATAVYGVMDLVERKVTVAGAGHPPPVVVGDGPPREIMTEGPLLGVFDDGEFDQASYDLGEDNMLVVYTDGLESAFPGEKKLLARDLRIDRIRRLTEVGASGGVRPVIDRLTNMLDQQAGSLHQADDLTFLALAAA